MLASSGTKFTDDITDKLIGKLNLIDDNDVTEHENHSQKRPASHDNTAKARGIVMQPGSMYALELHTRDHRLQQRRMNDQIQKEVYDMTHRHAAAAAAFLARREATERASAMRVFVERREAAERASAMRSFIQRERM
jgi:cation transport regulator ChaC